MAGNIDDLRRTLAPSQSITSGRTPFRGGSRITVVLFPRKTPHQLRQHLLHRRGNEFPVRAPRARCIPPRRFNRPAVVFHPNKRLDFLRHLNPEKANPAIKINQMPRAALAKDLPDGFDQFGEQEKIILEKGVRRHIPIRRGNPQHHLEPALRRGILPHAPDLFVDRSLRNAAGIDSPPTPRPNAQTRCLTSAPACSIGCGS